MDYVAWKFWLDILQLLLTAGVGLYVWLVTRTRINAARIRKLEGDIDNRLEDHGNRITAVEAAVKHGPKRDDLGNIHKRLDEVVTVVARIEGENRAMAGTVSLIHQHLLDRKP